MKNILIIGATSAIAQATARIWATEGKNLFLIGRNTEKLNALKGDLLVRGAAQADTFSVDLKETASHPTAWEAATHSLGDIDSVLIAHGILGNQESDENNPSAVSHSIRTNFESCASFLTLMAPYFENRGKGIVAVISSVAGDRGRRSNYIYGSAKAGLDAFLSGFRARLFKKGVYVINIKPGFVDTPMTGHIKKNFLFASPQKIAKGIICAMKKGKSQVYLPGFWRWIMLIIRALPECIIKRLPL